MTQQTEPTADQAPYPGSPSSITDPAAHEPTTPDEALRQRIEAVTERAISAWDAEVPGADGHLHQVIAAALLPLFAEEQAAGMLPASAGPAAAADQTTKETL